MPAPAPCLGQPTRSGVQRPLVEADEQHSRVGFERRLGPVAVMGVVVEHPDPLAGCGERGRHDGHVGDEAEPHRVGRRGVVAGRPDGAERSVAATFPQRRHRREPGTCRQPGGTGRAGAQPGVGVDPAAAGFGHLVEPVEVPRRVDPLQIDATGGHRLELRQRVHHALPTGTGDDRLQAGRTLGMPRSGEVPEVRLVGDEQHRDVRRAYAARPVAVPGRRGTSRVTHYRCRAVKVRIPGLGSRVRARPWSFDDRRRPPDARRPDRRAAA